MAWKLLGMVRYSVRVIWREIMSETTDAHRAGMCLIPKCGGVAGANLKGLCMSCYKAAKRTVESGETTWEKLAEMGLCKGKTTPFDDAYSRAAREN